MNLALALHDRWPVRHAWLRWTASVMLVLALHAAALLTLRRSIPAFGTDLPDAILIDLAPEPAAPPDPPAPVPTPVAQPEPPPPEPGPPEPAPPEPEPPPEPAALPIPDAAPLVPHAALELPPALQPKMRPLPRKRQAAQPPAATAPAPAAADTAVSAPPGQVQATWEAQLVAHLARFKRFPPAAQRRGEQGVVLMRLLMGRGGTVLSMAMVRGSGYADLDEEATVWMTRAQPLPAAPPEITAQQLEVVVPLRFTLR